MATVTTLPRMPMTKAIAGVLATVTGKPVGISAAPRIDDPDDPTKRIGATPPYLILYPAWERPDEDTGPPLTAPNADPTWVYQISWYSTKGTQLEWLRDKVYAALLGRDSSGEFTHSLDLEPLAAPADDLDAHPGIKVMDREFIDEQGTPNPTGTLLEAAIRIAVKVTPQT